MQFGICKGPLDSINQIYIKELPVWCGLMTSASVLSINLPELFGGDLAEGGPVGTIECYFGDADQVMSQEVASRMGKTPVTMPGYRGIANLFFRYGPGSTTPSSSIFDLVYDLVDMVNGVGPPGGFKWSTNNPYLPSTWVNCTRIPKSLSESFATIYPYDPDWTQENDVTVSINGTTTLTLADMGVTAEQVDSGIVTLTSALTCTMNYTGLGGSGPADGYVSITHRFYKDNGSGGVGVQIGSTYTAGPGLSTGGGTANLVEVLPPLTRFVKIQPTVLPTFPIFTATSYSHTDLISFPSHNGGWCAPDGTLTVLPQANPAHMIYEALNDSDWGMSNPRTGFDLDSFMYAAEVFYNERFGLSILWSEQMEIEKYVTEILDHVQASLFVDPKSGLWRLIPYRADYDVNSLLVLDPTNCRATNRQRKGYAEIVNEVVVSWTNPENEGEETVTFQDPASISTQGLVSTTRNYYGVRYVELANQLGARDIRAASYPTFMADFVALRDMSNIFPGSVVKLNWPEDGIEGMVLRVGKVDYGQPGDKYVRFPATEDIYGLEAGQYVSIQKTGWVNPNVPPAPMDILDIMTAPLALYARAGHPVTSLTDATFPIVPVALLGNRSGADAVESFDVMGQGFKPNGETETVVLANLPPTPTALLSVELVAEAVTYMTNAEMIRFCGYYGPETGAFLNIGSGDTASELVMLDSYNTTTGWKLARGMYDTVPQAWPVGTRAWFIGDALRPIDPSEQNAGVEADYYLLPKSSGGKLALADAPLVTFVPSDRPYAPDRPSNVSVAASGAGALTTSHPVAVQNASAESQTSGVPNTWTMVHMAAATDQIWFSPNYHLYPRTGLRFFKPGGTIGYDASMEQILSIPAGMVERIDTGAWPMNVKYWRSGMVPNQDWIKVTVEFYNATSTLISTFTGAQEFAESQPWAQRKITMTVPALARSYKLRFDFKNTSGTTTDVAIDDISVDYAKGDWPILTYVGTEVPTTLTFSWANRNRLMEDTIAPRWSEANVTPETGQTVTIRCREKLSRAIEYEVTGLTGTSYALDVTALTDYRFYDIEVLAVRDGYESIQFFTTQLEMQRLGYGNNYGYDYGENDGA
jgi:hypothetical protein